MLSTKPVCRSAANVVGLEAVTRWRAAATPERYSMRTQGKLALVFLPLVAGAICCNVPARAQEAKAPDPEVQQLRDLVMKLQSRIDQLERNLGTNAQPARDPAPASPPAGSSTT